MAFCVLEAAFSEDLITPIRFLDQFVFPQALLVYALPESIADWKDLFDNIVTISYNRKFREAITSLFS